MIYLLYRYAYLHSYIYVRIAIIHSKFPPVTMKVRFVAVFVGSFDAKVSLARGCRTKTWTCKAWSVVRLGQVGFLGSAQFGCVWFV